MGKATEDYKAKPTHRSKKLNNAKEIRQEVSCSSHIPYSRHVTPTTIKTFDGALIVVVRLEGFSFETADQSEINRAQEKRNALLYGMSMDRYAVWTTIIRRKELRFPPGDFQTGFSKDLNDSYKKKITAKDMFVNDLYLTIIRQRPSGKINQLADLLQMFSQKCNIESQKLDQKDALRELQEVTDKVLSSLSPYTPTVLTLKKTTNGFVSEPLSLFSYLINGHNRPVLVPKQSINTYLSSVRPFFAKDKIELKGLSNHRLIGGLTIKEYNGSTRPSILDGLLTLPFEFVLTQTFKFEARKSSLDKMKKQKRQLDQTNDDAVSLMEELVTGIDDLASGKISFGDHHFTLLCTAPTSRQLQQNLAEADSILADQGITSVREDIALESAFWAQLPANGSYIGRKSGISSQNFAAFSSFHNYPNGHIEGNHWGHAITLLETVSGTPFYFNFHVADLGNTTVIGPSGSGKTVLMTFLQAQLEKYPGLRRVYLDKDRGADIFIRAIGGNYATIEPGVKTGFNPFQLEKTAENESFLLHLVSFMLSENNEPLNAVDMSHATRLVKGNWKLDTIDRNISNLVAHLPQGQDNKLSERLKRWYGEGDLAWLFDCEKDEFPATSKTIGFDLSHILDEPTARAACLRYMFHRIDSLIDGHPISIVIDEGWKGLEDEYVSKRVFDWEKVIRKKNGILVFGSQSAKDLANTRIGSTIIEQSPTQIFYPNPDADRKSHCESFNLSDKEFHIIKHQLDTADRSFLIKQGRNSIVAKLNLNGMDDVIAILSGRKETISLLDEIRQEFGDDPKIWMPIFHEKRKQL
ncbi:MAG: VirB4 family type IV secretion/conjugal transfer ATPase [Sedimenticola sp.]